jgi:hypothetical protein
MNVIVPFSSDERVETQDDPLALVVKLPKKLFDRTRPDGGKVFYRVEVVLREIPVEDEPPVSFEVASATVSNGEVKMDDSLHGEWLQECLETLLCDFDKGLHKCHSDEGNASPSCGLTDLTREQVRDRLLAVSEANPDKTNLEMIADMKEGGVLFGVDKNGKLLAADRGVSIVKYIRNFETEEVTAEYGSYGLVGKGNRFLPANYSETDEHVYGPEGQPTGYEMFPRRKGSFCSGKARRSFEIQLYMNFTGEPFTAKGTYAFLDNGRQGEKEWQKDYVPGYQVFTRKNNVCDINSSHDMGDRMRNRGTCRLYRF